MKGLKSMKTLSMVVLLVSLLATVPAFAQHEDAAHGGHKHHISVFLGNTHDYHGEDAFTVGLDYEYRLTDLFGIGALIDQAGGDIESTVAGLALFVHPCTNARLFAVAANEHSHGHDEYITRLGVNYDIHVSSWTLSPIVEVDFLEHGENWIYGLGFGRGF